jgi:Predicted membrane protein (DUF2232)
MAIKNVLFGVACGAVSALLFAVISTSSPLAFVLYLASPLPILIATLGFTPQAGIAASFTAAICTTILFSPYAGVVHLLSIGLPSWIMAYLALLGRKTLDDTGHEKTEWYPLGRLLFWIVALSALLSCIGVRMLAADYGSLVDAFESVIREVATLEPSYFSTGAASDAAFIHTMADIFAAVAAPLSAAMSVIVSVILLYCAGRIVRASGRLPRPWPDLASTALPRMVLPLTAALFALSIFTTDYTALFARTALSALVIGLCLQGLAVLHGLTRPLKSRRALLGLLYASFLFLPGWPVIGCALLGLADLWFRFRERRFTPIEPPPLTS